MAKGVKTGGRKAGKPNSMTAGVKANLLEVFEQIGGVRYFAQWAKDNPTEFYKHYMKLMPTVIAGDSDNPVAFTQIERVIVETPNTDS